MNRSLTAKFRFLGGVRFAAALVVFLAAQTLCAQTAQPTPRRTNAPAATAESLIANVANRKTTNLNGYWRYIADPYETGYYNYRLEPDENGYFTNQKPRDRSDRVEYDFDTADNLNVPGDWNSQRDQLFLYEGTIWYFKRFDYTGTPNSRQFLYFGAANYNAKVYLNGEMLGEHTGGFTPFDFEITGKLKPTGNFVVVKVDNKRLREGVPTVNTDWWNYGGLTRDVKIVETPQTFVQNYHVQLAKNSLDRIAGWVQLSGAGAANKEFAIEIPEANLRQTARTDAKGRAKVDFPAANLRLWTPESPKLYDVAISTDAEKLTDRIGFRQIAVRGQDVFLNGKPVFLRGVSIHEEAPFRAGRAFSPEDARTLLGWAKEMNCNFVRLAHYTHNENMLRAADEMGIMVWGEVPVYWTIEFENPETYKNAENQLAEMIERDRNRAAIIMWSVANETPVTERRNDFLRRLAATARRLDATRLVTAAMDTKRYVKPDTITVDDPLGAFLDILGVNEYIGWYDGLPLKTANVKWETPYDKPLIMSEYGADALYNLRGDRLDRWTEDYQKFFYEEQIKMLKKITFLRGSSPWILMDFRSPRRPLPNVQDFFNRKGLISVRGDKKQAFFVMQDFYRELIEKYNRTK